MPQFPIPPWPEGASPLTTRRCRVRASGRHRFVPVVHGDADGVTVHLDSGDEAAIDRARFASNAETLFFQDNVGKPHLVVANRNASAWLAKVNRTVAVGTIEWWSYTAAYAPPLEVSKATTMQERRAALEAELAYLDQVTAEGWELVHAPGLFSDEPYAYLVDTMRPDLPLTAADLP